MGTWGEIGQEIKDAKADPAVGAAALDHVRRKYLALLHEHTGRATVLYATKWTQPGGSQPISGEFISITNEDVHGFMEALHGLETDRLDLILHSPGGSAEAAEAIVTYLRSKFDNIRVIVPHMAKSAATMIACAADEIVMGKHSFLGPIDPQFVLNTSLGPRMVPAQAIIEQFEKAKEDCKDPNMVRAWLPMLSQYGPELLVSCQNASDLGEELVREWLARYMFRTDRKRKSKARAIAKWLSTHSHFKSHARSISRDDLQDKGLNITALEADQDAQGLILSVFHATSHTFNLTGAVKIIENHLGKAYLKMLQEVIVQQVPAQPAQPVKPSKERQPAKRRSGSAKKKAKSKETAKPKKSAATKIVKSKPSA